MVVLPVKPGVFAENIPNSMPVFYGAFIHYSLVLKLNFQSSYIESQLVLWSHMTFKNYGTIMKICCIFGTPNSGTTGMYHWCRIDGRIHGRRRGWNPLSVAISLPTYFILFLQIFSWTAKQCAIIFTPAKIKWGPHWGQWKEGRRREWHVEDKRGSKLSKCLYSSLVPSLQLIHF